MHDGPQWGQQQWRGYQVPYIMCTLSTLVGIGVGFTEKHFCLWKVWCLLKHLQVYLLDCNSTDIDWNPILFKIKSARSWIRIFDVMWVWASGGMQELPWGCLRHISCSLLSAGSLNPHFIHKGAWGIPSFWAPSNPRSRCWRGSPTYLSALFPGQIKPEKSFYFEKSNLFWTHVFSHTWAGEIILMQFYQP